VVAVLEQGVLLATVQRQCVPADVTAFGKNASSMQTRNIAGQGGAAALCKDAQKVSGKGQTQYLQQGRQSGSFRLEWTSQCSRSLLHHHLDVGQQVGPATCRRRRV
jgi:hypothetical protein